MAAPALEAYLVKEISDRLGFALAADVIAQIVADTAAGNKVNSAAVKVTTYAELNSMFALVKAKGLAVYANQSTIYKYLTSIVDTTGRPVFQPSAQAGIQGFLIGAPVKDEDACSDNLFYIGAPKKVMGNMVQDILIEQDRDIKRHVDVYAGYARFECKLTKSTAFAILTVKQA
jgi:HK97 family phage major capsid protein